MSQHDVRPGDWTCLQCGANVFASKSSCFKCGAPKPGAGAPGGHMGDTQPSAPSPAPAPGSGGYGGGYGGGLPTSHPMFAAMSGGQMQMPGGFPPAPGGFPPAPGGGLLAPPSMLGMGMGMGGPPGPPGGPPPGAPGGLDMTNPVIAKQVAAQNAAAKLMQEKNFGSMGQPADQGGGEAERGRPREVSEDEDGGRRKRKKRWGDSSDRAHGVMAIIPKAMTDKQQQVYVMHVQIQEIGQKLMMPGLGINYNDPRRSPSPEPVYSHDGKRMNTREMRTKKKLEETRHDMIEKVRKLDMNYKPPAGYVKREIKIMDKIPIPQDEHPHIGFMGLLIGPRGNTLKKIQQETRCKVMIRGKGTEKEGKGRSSNKMPQPGDGEPMHAIVEAPTHEFLKKGCDRIRQIIKVGIECPDGHNELKRMQLRELAALNGTLREEEMMARCTQCGSFDHKTYQCKQQKNFVNETKCGRCGGMGHMTSDCTVNLENMPTVVPKTAENMDSEYMALMSELGEGKKPAGPPPGPAPAMGGGSGPAPTMGGRYSGGGGAPKPWEQNRGPSAPSQDRRPSGGPAPWERPRQNSYQPPPPGGQGGYGGPPAPGGYGGPPAPGEYGGPPAPGGYGAPPPGGGHSGYPPQQQQQQQQQYGGPPPGGGYGGYPPQQQQQQPPQQYGGPPPGGGYSGYPPQQQHGGYGQPPPPPGGPDQPPPPPGDAPPLPNEPAPPLPHQPPPPGYGY